MSGWSVLTITCPDEETREQLTTISAIADHDLADWRVEKENDRGFAIKFGGYEQFDNAFEFLIEEIPSEYVEMATIISANDTTDYGEVYVYEKVGHEEYRKLDEFDDTTHRGDINMRSAGRIPALQAREIHNVEVVRR